jgi:site-specific DNA-methyltransferase (adenine-specific)
MNGIVREVTIGDCRLIQGDCLEVMPGLESVDCVLTDPPYGTTACKWDSVIPFAPMWAQLKRITKPNGAIVLMASQPFTSALVMSNVAMFKYDWVWEKTRGSNPYLARYRPLTCHESILVFYGKNAIYNPQKTGGAEYKINKHSGGRLKGDNKLNSKDFEAKIQSGRFPRSVQTLKNASSEMGLHATQKPVALMEYLIRTYTNPGETVLDFTMGSGTTGVAAANTERRFIGIERDPNYFDVAVKRTREAVEQAPAPVQGGMGF